MDLYQTKIPAPQDWQQLQRIAKDFYERRYPGCTADEYGRNGQAQDGVDIYVYDNVAVATGVQCKCVDGFFVQDLRDEFAKTATFKNPLRLYIVVATVRRDTALVDEAVRLTRTNARGIRVEVKFWQALAEEMACIEDLARKHLKFVTPFPVYVSARGGAAHVVLEAGVSSYAFVVTSMSGFPGRYERDDKLVLVTSLAAGKKANFHRLQDGHWTDFHGIVGITELDAFAVWMWFRRFGSFEELARTSGEPQVVLMSTEELNRLRRKGEMPN